MVQGLFGGCTSYKSQTIEDILDDVEWWIKYSREMKKFFEESKDELLSSRFWNKIPCNFQMTIETSLVYCDTILHDLNLIKNSIVNDCITKREVSLLTSIGKKSREYNFEYGRHFKEDDDWHEFENEDFRIAEKVYADGRDFFITLQDAGNAAERLEDYRTNTMMNNNVNIIGNMNGSQIQQGCINSSQTMINPSSFNYDDMLKRLEEIRNDYIAESQPEKIDTSIEAILNKLIEMTKKEDEPEKMKGGLEFLKDITSGTVSSMLSSKILNVISTFFN